VSERLEQVHKGLGEMQTLASGVGDLKRVLTNVTTRGAWGEVQTGESAGSDSFAGAVRAQRFDHRHSRARGVCHQAAGAGCGHVWLPIDAKFPVETYQRLAAAAERGDAPGVEAAARELETVVRSCARTFSGKYLAPPLTTDFGVLFLATEGLYAEHCGVPGLPSRSSRTTASCWPVRRPLPRCSTACRWLPHTGDSARSSEVWMFWVK